MEIERIGKAISYLRKRAGYTQKDLADRIGISDKAVSKWERGLGMPDVGYLRKLSILLDTDTDSLLAGDVVHHDASWSGIIILDENSYGIGAGTVIYDKPLIYYLISYFLLVGIRDIVVSCTKSDVEYIDRTLGNGGDYGIRIDTVTGGLRDITDKKVPNHKYLKGSSAGGRNIMMVYGRCLLYGVDQTRFFQKAMMNRDRFTMLVLPKKMSHQSSRIVMDQNKKVINSNVDEPLKTQYDFSDIPILFFPESLLPTLAGKEDISSFIAWYANDHELYVHMLDRGFVEIEVNDWNNVQEASVFMKIVQDKCGMNVYCLEEVAWRRGMISIDQLKVLGLRYAGTEYGDYILSLHDNLSKKTIWD